MTTLLLDEMLGTRVAAALTDAGFTVQNVAGDPDLVHRPDTDILDDATSTERILLTRNVGDFALLDQQRHAAGRTHEGIVRVTGRIRQDRDEAGPLSRALLAAQRGGDLPSEGQVRWLRLAAD